MRERLQTQIDKIFSVLLFSLPQGALYSLIVIAYSGWANLTLSRME